MNTNVFERIRQWLRLSNEVEIMTPNEALAKLRGCKPSECLWVWNSKIFANKPMCISDAFRAAREKDLDL